MVRASMTSGGRGSRPDGSRIILDTKFLVPESGAFISLMLNSPSAKESDMVMQERKYAARVGLRLCHAMRVPASVYAIFNYCVGASGVPASVLNIVGNQPLYTDPMPLRSVLIADIEMSIR